MRFERVKKLARRGARKAPQPLPSCKTGCSSFATVDVTGYILLQEWDWSFDCPSASAHWCACFLAPRLLCVVLRYFWCYKLSTGMLLVGFVYGTSLSLAGWPVMIFFVIIRTNAKLTGIHLCISPSFHHASHFFSNDVALSSSRALSCPWAMASGVVNRFVCRKNVAMTICKRL